MRLSRLLLAASLVPACLGSRSGTAVGNPGDRPSGDQAASMDAVVRSSDANLALERAQVPVEVVWLDGCDGSTERIEVDRILDGLQPSLEPIEIPGGAWCTIELGLSDPIVVEGITILATVFEVELGVEALAQHGSFRVDGGELLFSIELPFRGAQIDSLGANAVALGADDPTAIQWASELEGGLSLWLDQDSDGRIASGDQFLGEPVGMAMSEDAGCGCAAGGGAAGWLGPLLLLGLGLRRAPGRRRRR